MNGLNASNGMKSPPARARSNGNMFLAAILMTAFLTPFTGSALNLSIPDISSDLHAGAVLVGWVMTGYILASAAFAVPFGRVADIKGRRPVLLAGLCMFMAMSFVSAFSVNIYMLIVVRFIQGIGGAMLFATTMAIVVAAYPPKDRGRMLGITVSSTYTGLSIGPVIGGILNQHFGWRAIFLTIGIIAGLTLIVSVLYLKEPAGPGPRGEDAGPGGASRFEVMDTVGNFLYIASMLLILYGFTDVITSSLARIALVLGLVLLVFFVRHEQRAMSPVIRIDLFTKNLAFSLSNVAAMLNYGASFSISYMMAIYLQSVQSLSSQLSGLVLITSPVFQAVLSPLTGSLSDKVPPYWLASIGMGITGVGVFCFVFVGADTSLIWIIAIMALIGIGFALFSSPNSNAIMSSVDKKDFSIASSVQSTSRTFGQTVSMAILSSVIAATVGNITLASASEAAILGAMRVSFIIFTILSVVGIFCSAYRGKF